jgi:8-oxo-dGTP pyrophosphatase MutT (NUDIX family)
VAVLRNTAHGIETLMLRKNSKIAFGGMWVFPGGRIDEEDKLRAESSDNLAAARIAAVREAEEEASVVIDPNAMVHFAFWLPPAHLPKRFATWFFVAAAGEEAVVIDDGEITEYQWMCPKVALEKCDESVIELATPTWVSLHTLCAFTSVEEALQRLQASEPQHFETRMVKRPEGLIALWEGDAGYETTDADVPGPRHRLEMIKGAYQYIVKH